MDYPFQELFAQGNALAYYTEVDGANTIEYFCTPRQPNAELTDPYWKVMKMITVTATGKFDAGKSVLRAGGSPDYVNVATDLNIVKALSFS